jgi:hypothetical protein
MSRISQLMIERRISYKAAARIVREEAQGSLAAPHGSARASFEKWISGPPYERETERWPQDETKYAWPGQYKDIAVQLAWQAWQQAQNAEVSDVRGAHSLH